MLPQLSPYHYQFKKLASKRFVNDKPDKTHWKYLASVSARTLWTNAVLRNISAPQTPGSHYTLLCRTGKEQKRLCPEERFSTVGIPVLNQGTPWSRRLRTEEGHSRNREYCSGGFVPPCWRLVFKLWFSAALSEAQVSNKLTRCWNTGKSLPSSCSFKGRKRFEV